MSHSAATGSDRPISSGSSNADPSESVIEVGTLIRFLCGSRAAILTLASNRDSIWLGLILALSAGFVREYDRADLLHQPWLVAVPVIAALGFSLILFPLVEFVARRRGSARGNYGERFHTFVAMLLLTAPLGWIFLLPVERLMSADESTITNLWLLGVVNLWRILLFARVLAVLYVPRANELVITGTIFIVMLVVDTVLLCNLGGDRPVMMVGHGSGAFPGEFVVLRIMSLITILGVITWPVWFVGTLMVAIWEGTEWSWSVPKRQSPPRMSQGIKVLAAASLLIWGILLPFTQPEHQRRYALEQTRQKEILHEATADDSARADGHDLQRH